MSNLERGERFLPNQPEGIEPKMEDYLQEQLSQLMLVPSTQIILPLPESVAPHFCAPELAAFRVLVAYYKTPTP